MVIKKIIRWLHLWLGLTSGLVVLTLGVTGCLYVFINEIEPVISTYQIVPVQRKPYLLPSQLKSIAEKSLPGKKANYISYQTGKAAYIGLYGTGYNLGFYADPYTGKQVKVKDYLNDFDFFSFVLNGHMSLWLPPDIGRPIVNCSVLIFIILLISGIVLWWPGNLKKHSIDRSFKIKWRAKFKRVNYDLHKVLGFYAAMVLLVSACTGLVWGFQWFARSVYWAASGGKALPEFTAPLSDTSKVSNFNEKNMDKLWLHLHARYPHDVIFIFFPEKKSSAIQVNVNHQPGKSHDTDLLYFDQYTLQPLPGTGTFKKPFGKAALGDQVSRLNYDLHTGQVLGLPTKILAFFASLICASLPVTGFCIWWGKRRKLGKQPGTRLKSTKK